MTTKQHILVVTQYFWPERFRINDLVLGLQERGYRITVLTGKPNYPQGKFFPGYNFVNRSTEDYFGITVIRSPILQRGKSRIKLLFNYISFVLFGSITAILRCREKYDAIFVYEPSPITVGLPAIVVKKMTKAPIFFWVQDLWPEAISAAGGIKSQTIYNIVGKLVKYIYEKSDFILAQSKGFFQHIEKWGIPNQKILYYPNYAEDFYQPIILEENAPELDKMPKGFRIMFAGTIGASQDFGTILAAAEKLKEHHDINWIIVGNGRMFPWVKEQIELKELKNVHLLGEYPAESMPRFFATADVMLVTLGKEPSFAATIPAKVPSYLACAKPIVAALDGEGGNVIMEAGAGIAVSAADPDKLAEAILSMYNLSNEERSEMGKKGLEYYKLNFDRTMLLDKLDNWIQNIK